MATSTRASGRTACSTTRGRSCSPPATCSRASTRRARRSDTRSRVHVMPAARNLCMCMPYLFINSRGFLPAVYESAPLRRSRLGASWHTMLATAERDYKRLLAQARGSVRSLSPRSQASEAALAWMEAADVVHAPPPISRSTASRQQPRSTSTRKPPPRAWADVERELTSDDGSGSAEAEADDAETVATPFGSTARWSGVRGTAESATARVRRVSTSSLDTEDERTLAAASSHSANAAATGRRRSGGGPSALSLTSTSPDTEEEDDDGAAVASAAAGGSSTAARRHGGQREGGAAAHAIAAR